MRDNINKVAERGERLDSLESKTGMAQKSGVELTGRQSRCIGPGIQTWRKPCPETNVVESASPQPLSICF